MEFRSQPLSQTAAFPSRLRTTALVVACVFSVFGLRVGYLTIVQGDQHSTNAEKNLRNLRRIEAPRGNIFDTEMRPLAQNRRAYSVTYSRYHRTADEVRATLNDLAEIVGPEVLDHEEEILSTRYSWTRVTLARRLSVEQVSPILERPSDFKNVRLSDDFRREYSFGADLAHLTGYVGKITAEDGDRFTRPLYLPDAYVGRSGLEKAFEENLVGKPGVRRFYTNAKGELLDSPAIDQIARPGDDLILTVDATLQQVALDGLGESNGSVVMMDVRSGGLLVMASTPTFDPSAPGRPEIDGKPTSEFCRAYRGRYPPASTAKIVTAAAALRAGWNEKEHIHCSGKYYWLDWPRPFRCNNRYGHGSIDLSQALKSSCNVYFYELSDWLGGERIAAEAERFGFSSKTGIELRGEAAGSLTNDGEPPSAGNLVNFSIGQGQFLATPLQVARSYAALANGGDLIRPYLVAEIQDGDGNTIQSTVPGKQGSLGLSNSDQQFLVSALKRVIRDTGGTARKVGFKDHWEVAGKTGTAENGQGGTDAWFACFFPASAPEFALIVHVEDVGDGGGGDVAAPIARDVIQAYFDTKENKEPSYLAQN